MRLVAAYCLGAAVGLASSAIDIPSEIAFAPKSNFCGESQKVSIRRPREGGDPGFYKG